MVSTKKAGMNKKKIKVLCEDNTSIAQYIKNRSFLSAYNIAFSDLQSIIDSIKADNNPAVIILSSNHGRYSKKIKESLKNNKKKLVIFISAV
ncbi:MAG: hypothetical protein D6734_10735, partial [Candidatus Schekmanbacteria bacterium]